MGFDFTKNMQFFVVLIFVLALLRKVVTVYVCGSMFCEVFKNQPKAIICESNTVVGDQTETLEIDSSSSNCVKTSVSNEELKRSDPKAIDSIKRRRVSNRVGCKARLVMRLHGVDRYIVTLFEERHNHPMTSIPSSPFLKVNRALDIGHQNFVLNCSKANIGTMKCYRLYKEIVGGYSNIGATSVDFKNFKLDLKAYVAGVDAQMLIDKLFRKRETCSEFFFNYDVDGSDQLTRIFRLTLFVERIMLCSEMLSHSMLLSRLIGTIWYFVPFTGVENHKKCITFGAGLLLKEDVESYIWVFRSFISAMTKEPTCIITDQDPAMRVAFEQIFKTARHRYCMWHIMSKVTSKILDPCVFP
ncbi:unnamed protein product [Cuscuta europaea]|uniref:Protein FAR1-RELATED SEQUENCE n=1 Tax=Cuscuta europaea TaxID=41803 RepID=A0A9P1EGX0_CUSEU|nr:unnamed protein product [Cuscuta europaea]